MVGGVKLSEANHFTGDKIIYSMHANFRTSDGICAEAKLLTGPDFLTLNLERDTVICNKSAMYPGLFSALFSVTDLVTKSFFAVRGSFFKLFSIGSERFARCLCAPGAFFFKNFIRTI